jgi:hypothetical protein
MEMVERDVRGRQNRRLWSAKVGGRKYVVGDWVTDFEEFEDVERGKKVEEQKDEREDGLNKGFRYRVRLPEDVVKFFKLITCLFLGLFMRDKWEYSLWSPISRF